eukprot:m.64970 g.64970  ORF g.64970 m.64970 type:complete len:148 (-) comp14017_c0_seq10:672-1115(-)
MSSGADKSSKRASQSTSRGGDAPAKQTKTNRAKSKTSSSDDIRGYYDEVASIMSANGDSAPSARVVRMMEDMLRVYMSQVLKAIHTATALKGSTATPTCSDVLFALRKQPSLVARLTHLASFKRKIYMCSFKIRVQLGCTARYPSED